MVIFLIYPAYEWYNTETWSIVKVYIEPLFSIFCAVTFILMALVEFLELVFGVVLLTISLFFVLSELMLLNLTNEVVLFYLFNI